MYLLCFRFLLLLAPLWIGLGSPIENQKGYVLAHLLLWTVGLVRDNVAMAEGLLGLLTEQELHVASARLGRQGRRWPVALAPYVQRGPGAESGRYTEDSLLSACPAGRPLRVVRASILL